MMRAAMRCLPPELILKDPKLNAQHEFLFQLLDMAEKQGTTTSPAEVATLVKAMLLYCKTHFAYEESLMAADGWPGLVAHAADHALFQRRCIDLTESIGISSRPGVPGGLSAQLVSQTLRTWLHDHILQATTGDVAYVAWHRAQGKL